jgi:predicted TIM-barrel fold metal-dependent hydrolase
MGLPALVFVRLWDERSHHWCMQVPPLSVGDLSYVLTTYPEVPVAVCNANLPVEGAALAPILSDRAQTLLTTAYKSLKLAEMVDLVGAEHIAYASGMPLYYPESALLQVLDADIDERARALILAQNARAFLGLEEGDDAH